MNSIVIAGPTASGKTAVAAELAAVIGGEIISADSRQVYKYLDIGTNKAGELSHKYGLRITCGIPQHLTDLVEPDKHYSAGAFVKAEQTASKEIFKNKKVPIITGGTGLYIKALIDGLAELPEKDEAFRAGLNLEIEKFGLKHLYDRLKTIDAESAEKNKNNRQRLVRALEVYSLTGKPISLLHKSTKKPAGNYLLFAVLWKREELYENISRRVKTMLDSGMIDETKNVLSKGFSKTSPGLQSLGYRHVINYLENKISRTDMESLICADTRHYAKRQLTWFRNENRIEWIETSSDNFSPPEIAKKILSKLRNLI